MRRFKLVKPEQAEGRTRELYEDIMKTWGKQRLVPVFGFWGRDPDVLASAWLPCKKFEHGQSKTPADILVGACLVGAMSVGCQRCIVFHATDLTDRLGVDQTRADQLANYKASFEAQLITEAEYIALRYADCLCQGMPFEPDEWDRLCQHYDDDQIFEIAVVSLVEGMYAKYGQVMAPYDESLDWPEEYRPSGAYATIMSK